MEWMKKKIANKVKNDLANGFPGPCEQIADIKLWNDLWRESGEFAMIEATSELKAVRKVNGFWENMGFYEFID